MNIHIITMGCAKNSVDSEHMAGYLAAGGHALVDSVAEAEVVIINTCGFIRPAVEENIETILELAREKEEGHFRYLIVAGCLSQRYQDDLAAELPEVDAFLGSGEYAQINQILLQASQGNRPRRYQSSHQFPADLPRVRQADGPSTYLKVAEGCPRLCSYCIIPRIRGPLHSRQPEDILQETAELVSRGIKEVVLVAQDTTAYGVDLAGKSLLPDLLGEVCGVDGLRWVRFLYSYPELISDRLLEVMAKEEKICAYLDLPLQHTSGKIVRSMGRKGSAADYLRLIEKVRTSLPNVALRSTFIVGYPGETEDDFHELLDFIDQVRFQQLAVFTYYPEEGTPAASLPEQVPEDIAYRRLQRLTDLQEAISWEINQTRVGKMEEVLVETVNSTERVFSGRTYREAPEIDALVVARPSLQARVPKVGEIVPVAVQSADSRELQGLYLG